MKTISEPTLFANQKFEDSRGFFTERFREGQLKDIGPFIQDNFSHSRAGVLRGLHYQIEPAQGKLVTCLRGEIFDVAVDIRKGSKTFGQHQSFSLNGDEPRWLWIPEGFAHGFAVVSSDGADVMYKVTSHYSPAGDRGILWNDPTLQIPWPLREPIMSDKDLRLQTFEHYTKTPDFVTK